MLGMEAVLFSSRGPTFPLLEALTWVGSSD
jgi:hypothetical protein